MPSTVTTVALRKGDAGVQQTLARLDALVTEGVRSPLVINTARQLIAHHIEKDPLRDARTLYGYVRDRIRFVRDPVGVELLRAPARMIEEIQARGRAVGDCDEASGLLAALLRAVGVRTRFRVLGIRPGSLGDSRFSHVYVEALLDGEWVPMDTTGPLGFGRAPTKRVIHSAAWEDGTMSYLSGLGQVEVAPKRGFLEQVISAGTEVLPVLERYGIFRPRTYTPEGRPIYTEPLPVQRTGRAVVYQQLTKPVQTPLGTMTQGQLLTLIALGVGGALLLPSLMRGRR